MSGRRDDDVIAHHVAIIERLPVNRGIGDGAGNIAGRIGALFRRQPRKISLEILDRARYQLRDRLWREILHPRLVEIFVLPAKHLLGQHKHARFVFFRNAQYLHDHMQRIGRGNELAEIDLGPAIEHALHGIPGDRANFILYLAQVLGHEPVLRQLAVFHMDRRIEGHQARHHVRAAAGHLPREFDALGQ